MKMFYFLAVTVLCLMVPVGFLFGQIGRFAVVDTVAQAQGKMAILPFHSLGIDYVSIQTAELLLRQEIGKLTAAEIISENETRQMAGDVPCTDVACAAEIGEQLGADEVVFCSLSRLGEKIVVQYGLADVASKKKVIVDNTASETVEDLEAVMKRVALSIVNRKPMGQTAEVGAITEREIGVPRRRSALGINGVSFGYLYPQHGYDNDDRSFALDYRRGYEMERIAVGAQFAIRKGIALNIYTSYLITKTDFCPYIGGAFGFHWVSHDEDSDNDGDNLKSDGFEFIINTGIRAFRTYNFQVLLNFDYAFTLNDYDDEAIVFTIGLLH
ncbi:MAG: hypothetical protein JSV84_04395 [Gemmatimonadota bacterium]|nr:MAG: hypothetical protein JSV84_04395 [Gemmatimonadota bacterium]